VGKALWQALREYFKKAGGSMLEIYDRWEREMAAYSTTVRCEVCQRTTHLVSVDRGCDDRYEAGDLTAATTTTMMRMTHSKNAIGIPLITATRLWPSAMAIA
jgi:hypothetical protein